MSEVKCQVFPSGTSSWHVWEVGAKEGDPCQCGQLPYVKCHAPKESEIDHELHQQIQWKLEACKKAEDLQSKLTEMEQCLSWCSENVLFARFVGDPQNLWFVDLGIVHPIRYHAPTLYAALKSAWEGRDK